MQALEQPDLALMAISDVLVTQGFGVWANFFTPTLIEPLRTQALNAWQAGQFQAAKIGQGSATLRNPRIRSDQVLWLEPEQGEAVGAYLQFLEDLRAHLNQALYLGVFEAEAHFAVYAEGSFYQRHIDNFRASSPRAVTVLTYLNADWQADDSGELRLYLPETEAGFIDIAPQAGALVVFLSDQFEHEVLPTKRERLSVSGWLRRRV